MQPDLAELDPVIDQGDKRLAALAESLPADDPGAQAQVALLQGQVIRAIGERYLNDPPPANFRVNVNPLVAWIWIGGGVGAGRRPDRDLAGADRSPPRRLRRLRGAART